jgi:1-acyl-sn-glycerol-3-phosphate acyltransferase
MPEQPSERTTLFYKLAGWLTRRLLDLLSRWSISGLQHVPLGGTLLVVCNHQNNADPIILMSVMPRAMHLMAKEELFRWPIGVLAHWSGAFPVRRGHADRQAIKTALDLLARGACVGLFPEGTRSRTGALIQAQTGAGLIGVRSGAPILPVAIIGTGRLKNLWAILSRPRIEIIVGEPFELPASDGESRTTAAAHATELMMGCIAALLPPTMRGAYGTHAGPGRW